MSVFDVLERLNALDFNQLSMQERRAGEDEVRQLLDKLAKGLQKDPATLSKKIALLKIWQKFDQLKIKDEQEKKALRESLKAAQKLAKAKMVQEESASEPSQSLDDEAGEVEQNSVSIKINEDVEVDGVAFENGTIVQVPEHSVKKLIATDKTEKVDASVEDQTNKTAT